MKKSTSKPAQLHRGYFKMAIIKAMRGFDSHAPAVGERNCICEAVLLERIYQLTGEKLNNETLCSLLKELRDLYDEQPQKSKVSKIYYWSFVVETPEGKTETFSCTANDYICGSNKGRYFPANIQELEKYQQQRKADYLTQLKNSKTAAIACRHFFIEKSPKLF
jgi:hypothetical protein